jgi:hypothetical protein
VSAKSIAGWLVVAVVIWLVIENHNAAAMAVHNIGSFLSSAASGLSSFLASI